MPHVTLCLFTIQHCSACSAHQRVVSNVASHVSCSQGTSHMILSAATLHKSVMQAALPDKRRQVLELVSVLIHQQLQISRHSLSELVVCSTPWLYRMSAYRPPQHPLLQQYRCDVYSALLASAWLQRDLGSAQWSERTSRMRLCEDLSRSSRVVSWLPAVHSAALTSHICCANTLSPCWLHRQFPTARMLQGW